MQIIQIREVAIKAGDRPRCTDRSGQEGEKLRRIKTGVSEVRGGKSRRVSENLPSLSPCRIKEKQSSAGKKEARRRGSNLE